jgi:hypothetical protein
MEAIEVPSVQNKQGEWRAIMWESVGVRSLYAILGAGVGVAAMLLFTPEPVPEVRLEIVRQVETKTIVETKWKTDTVVKWKERIVSQPDGTTTTERESVESTTDTGSTNSSADSNTSESVTSVTLTPDTVSRYQIGVEVSPLKYADLSNYRVSAYARIGDMPLMIGIYGQIDLTFGVGVRYEF